MEPWTNLMTALEEGDEERVVEFTTQALAAGTPALNILNLGLIEGMKAVGEKFRNHDLFLPDVLLAAKAMQAALAELQPHFARGAVTSRGKVILGTVKGDLHDIGKNLVAVMLRGGGFEVIDLGTDVAPEIFVERAERENATLIGMSALLTTTMPAMKTVIELLGKRNLRPRIRTIIGGAPVSAEYARQIGADGYAYDAASAVDRVRHLMEV